jgi:hypothetical protein
MASEHMGPSADDCPRAIFDLVTDFDDGASYGPAWRQRVAKRLKVHYCPGQLALL